MSSFLHLPFELQSLILTSAFMEALESDLTSQAVRPYSTLPAYHPTVHVREGLLLLSPMHQTTYTHTLFTQLLPLTIADENILNAEETTISSNQLTRCLQLLRKQLLVDSEDVKVQMRDIVLRQPWARVAGEAYCALWRRKERAELVSEVVEAALKSIIVLDDETVIASDEEMKDLSENIETDVDSDDSDMIEDMKLSRKLDCLGSVECGGYMQ